MRWNIKRTKLLLALIPIISIIFYVLTANNNIYADQSFVEFDIYQRISTANPPAEGKNSPVDYSAAENFAIAAQVYLDAESVESTTNGTVTAMGFYKQTVMNYRAKVGGHLFSESVSLSAIASVAEQRYFKDGALLYRSGIASGSAVKSWSDSIAELTHAVYRQRYGVVPQEITKYSVTDESILSGRFVSKNPDGTYTYELVMDAPQAHKFARYEMMTFAGVTSYPDFLSCRLVYTIDETWHVKEIKSYDTYKIDLMGGTKCDSSLTETFRFGDVKMPERAQPFIDYVITGNNIDIGTSKGPADYLSEAYGEYIAGVKPLNLTASVKLGKETLAVKGQIDIGANDFRFLINNELFVVYKDNAIYVAVGDNKLLLTLSDLSALGVSGDGLDLGGDILTTLFADYEMYEDDSHVHIIMPFELMGMHLRVDMGLGKQEDGSVTADTIDAQITVSTLTLDVTVRIEDETVLPRFNAAEYQSVGTLLQAAVNTIQAKAYAVSGNITVSAGDRTLLVDIAARIVKTKAGADVQGTVTAMGIAADIAYANDTLFLHTGNVAVKAATADIPALMETVTDLFGDALPAIELPDVQELLPQLLPEKPDIATLLGLLKNIRYADNTLHLSVQPADGETWSVAVAHDEQLLTSLSLRNFAVAGVGLQVDLQLDAANSGSVSVDPDGYIDVNDFAAFLPTIKELLDAQSYDLTVDGTVTVQGKSIPLSANAVLNRAPLAVRADVNAAGIPATIVYADDTVYLTAGEFAVKLALADLEKFSSVTDTLPDSSQAALALLQKLLPSDGMSIDDLLRGVTLASNDGTLTLRFAQGDLAAELGLRQSNTGLAVALQLTAKNFAADFDATVAAKQENAVITPNGEYLDLTLLIPFVAPVAATAQSRIFGVTLNGAAVGKAFNQPFALQATVDLTNGLALDGTLTVADLTVHVTLLNNVAYLRTGNLAFSLPLADIKELPAQIESLLTNAGIFARNLAGLVDAEVVTTALEQAVEMLQKATRIANNKPTAGDIPALLAKLDFMLPTLDYNGITGLLGGIKVRGNTLTLSVHPQNGTPYTIAITVDDKHITNISLSDFSAMGIAADIAAELTYPEQADIAPNGEYVSLRALANLLPAVNNLLTAQTYKLELENGQLITQKFSATFDGSVCLSPDPLQAYADLTLLGYNAQIFYANDRVFLTAGNFKATATVDDIQDLISEIASLLGKDSADMAKIVHTATQTITNLLGSLRSETPVDLLHHIVTLGENSDGSITAEIALGDVALSVNLAATDNALTLRDVRVAYGNTVQCRLSVTLSPADGLPAQPDQNEYLQLASLTPFIHPLYEAISSDSIVLDIYPAYIANDLFAEEFKMQLRLKKTTTDEDTTFALDGGIELSGTEIEFVLLDDTLYLTAGNLAFSVPLTDAKALPAQLAELLDNAQPFASDLSSFLKKGVAEKLATMLGKASELLKRAKQTFGAMGHKPDAKTVTALLTKLDFILPEIGYDSVTSLLGGITVESNRITLPVTPANGAPYTLTLAMRQDETTEQTVFDLGLHDLTLFGYTADIDAILSYGAEFEIEADGNYVSLQTVTDFLPALNNLLTANAYELELTDGGEITAEDGSTEKIFGNVNTAFLSGQISGRIQFTLSPLTIHADLVFASHEIDVRFVENTVYLRVNGIMVQFTVTDIKNLQAQLTSYLKTTKEFDEEQVQTLAALLDGALEKASLIQNLLGGKTIAELLASVQSLTQEDGNLCLTLQAGDFSGDIRLGLYTLPNQTERNVRVDITDLQYGNIVYNSAVYAVLTPIARLQDEDPVDPLGFAPLDKEKAQYVQLSDLQTYITPVVNMADETHIKLTFHGDVYAGGKDESPASNEDTTENAFSTKKACENPAANQTCISGELKIARTDGFADIYAKILLSGKTSDQSIEVYVIDGTVYRSESGTLLPDAAFDRNAVTAYVVYNGFHAAINYRSAMYIVGALRDILNLNVPMLNGLLQQAGYVKLDTTVFETMDIAGLDGLRDTLQDLLGTAEDVSGMAQSSGAMGLLGVISDSMVNKALKGVSLQYKETPLYANKKLLHISIDNKIFPNKTELPQDVDPAEIVLGHNDNLLTFVAIDNLIVNDDHVQFIAEIVCGTEGFTPITAPTPPSDVSMNDFSSIGDLLTGVIRTGALREFHISGKVTLKIIGIFETNLGIDVNVKILDDGTTVAAVRLDVPKYGINLGLINYSLEQSVSNIYYANERLYFVIDVYKSGKYSDTETISATVDEFLADPMFYMFKVVRLSQSIQDLITNADPIVFDLQNVLHNLNKVLPSYGYTADANGNGTYALVLGLQTLLNSKSFSDTTLKLYTSPNNYINGLHVDTTLVSVIGLALNATLDNLTYNGYDVTDANKLDPAYMANGTYPYSVNFGQSSDIVSLPLTHSITTIEDDLALIFPLEAMQSFAQMAENSHTLATAKTKRAAEVRVTIAQHEQAVKNTQAELEIAREKLAGIQPGMFGYSRAQAQVTYAEKAVTRAVRNLAMAQEEHESLIKEAEQAAATALVYAQKALKAVESQAAQWPTAAQSVYNAIQAEANGAIDIHLQIITRAENLTALLNDSNATVASIADMLSDTSPTGVRTLLTRLSKIPGMTESIQASLQLFENTLQKHADATCDTLNNALTVIRNKSQKMSQVNNRWSANQKKAIAAVATLDEAVIKAQDTVNGLQTSLDAFFAFCDDMFA